MVFRLLRMVVVVVAERAAFGGAVDVLLVVVVVNVAGRGGTGHSTAHRVWW